MGKDRYVKQLPNLKWRHKVNLRQRAPPTVLPSPRPNPLTIFKPIWIVAAEAIWVSHPPFIAKMLNDYYYRSKGIFYQKPYWRSDINCTLLKNKYLKYVFALCRYNFAQQSWFWTIFLISFSWKRPFINDRILLKFTFK